MAEPEDEMANGATTTLESTTHIPIAQLTPFLEAPSTRSVKAIVTLTWPYSSATGSMAFLLAEPDFRLRRTRGQVRAQFGGSSAKVVAKSGIASGDEVLLSLDGADWIQDEAPFATPGRGIEYDLKFTERLLLQFRQEESQEISLIDIDHPTPEEAPTQERFPLETASTTHATPRSTSVSARASPLINNGEEWSSPPFIKRARDIYGSLLGEEYDPFAEEDGTIRGKGRKRLRPESRLSQTWRVQSRSTSPEDAQEHTTDTSSEPEAQSKPMMTDEGSQTIGLEEDDAAEVLGHFRRQSTNVGSAPYLAPNGAHVTETHPQVSVEARHEPPELPSIQTQMDLDNTTAQQEAHFAIPAPKSPLSPRLQPVPSDALPLISPLITNRPGYFLGMGPAEGMASQASARNQQVATAAEELVKMSDNIPEDLYGASPISVHGQALLNGLNGFHDASVGLNALEEASSMQNQLLSEDQYGHWQTNNQQSRHVSPLNAGEQVMEDQQDGLFVEERQEDFDFQADGFLRTNKQHEYPDPDDGNYNHQISALWGPGSGRIAYPELPETGEKLSNDRFMQPPSRPRAVALSRSGSAQSAPVDLTEIGDEEEVEGENDDDVPVDGLIDEEAFERSDIGEDEDAGDERVHNHPGGYRNFREESSEDEEEDAMDIEADAGRRLQDGLRTNEEAASQFSQDSANEDESEEDADDSRRHQQRYYPEQFDEVEGFDEEEDEGSYDDDDDEMEEDNQKVQREPVVIDLLSSDEEDDEAPDVTNAKTATFLKPADVESADPERESEESDIGVEESARDPIPRHQSMELTNEDDEEDAAFEVEEEDSIVNGNQEGQLSDAENADEELEDATSGDDNAAQDLTALEQDPEMALEAEGKVVTDDEELDNTVEDEEIDEGDKLTGVEPLNNVVGDEKAAEVVEDVESKPQEDTIHEKHALQEVDEIHDAQDFEPSQTSSPSKVDKSSAQPSSRIAPPMFSLDGANDERPLDLYPSLPSEVIQVSLPPSQDAPVELSISANGQLPTPTDTQLSLVKDSSEVSIFSITGQTQLPQSASDQLVIDPALENLQQPNADITITVDEALTQIEAEIITTDAIDEETAKISLEEDSTEKPGYEKEVQVVVEAHNTRSRTRQQNSVEPVHDDRAVEAVLVSPRRSHRRGKSTSSTTETPQSKRLTTPSMSTSKARLDEPVSARTDRSSSIVLDERTTPKGKDASIQLAMAALDSPTKQPHDLRSKQPGLGMQLKLARTLRTELSEFTSLKVVKFKLKKELDFLGVVTTVPPEPERVKAGPRHYQISFNITDQSISPGGPHIIEVQVFRPYKDALPIVNEGDGILLRNFQVVSLKMGRFGLRSVDSSSWAVFGDDEVVDVRGPPVEYGPGEKKQMGLLRAWYRGLDSALMAKIDRANEGKGSTGGKSVGKIV